MYTETRHVAEAGGVLAVARAAAPGAFPAGRRRAHPIGEIRTPPMDPGQDTHLELGPLLGSGGFGDVYRARMRSRGGLQTLVAVKVIHPGVVLQDDAVARLQGEGQLLARIQHPAVVRALDLVRIRGRLALVTEYVPGADLAEFVQGPDRIPPRALVVVTGQVAGALAAAWSAPGPDGAPLRIVHRDIKPSNVRIGRHGEVRLLDFGIARFSDAPQETTSVILGSLPYMAPERFTQRQARAPSDVFGLGCCLYEGLTGRRFHPSGHLRDLGALALDVDRFEAHRLAQLSALQPGLDPDLIELLGACLAYEPGERPTAGALAERCDGLADALPGASLRRWCSEIPWSPPSEIAGAMSGDVLDPGSGGAQIPTTRPSPGDDGGPRIHHRPLGTLDPGMFGVGDSPPMKRSKSTPTAPPAFPSIPLGVALEQLQISQEEISGVFDDPPQQAGAVEPHDLHEPTQPPPELQHPPELYSAEGEASTQWVLLGLGCAAFVLVALIVSSAMVAVGLFFVV